MLFLLSVAASVVFLLVCYHDIRHRSIPNVLPIAVAAVAVAKWLLIGEWGAGLWALAAAVAAFAVTAVLFSRNWLGGGDVKLVSAAIFLLGAPAAPRFLLLMALIGGAIAVLVLLGLGRSRGRVVAGAGGEAAAESPTIPYGVAIATAAIAVMAIEGGATWPV